MSDMLASIHVTNWLGLGVLLVVWIVFFKCAHLLIMLMRHEPLIGWAIGPLGVTVMFLHEPSALYIWLDVLCPALVSGSVLYIGLFSSLAPISLPHHLFFEVFVLIAGVLLSSTVDFINALRDLRYPLWGEARFIRNVQALRARWARIHFTSFGTSYLHDHFGYSPTDLLQAL